MNTRTSFRKMLDLAASPSRLYSDDPAVVELRKKAAILRGVVPGKPCPTCNQEIRK
jgi:hypothetical protein